MCVRVASKRTTKPYENTVRLKGWHKNPTPTRIRIIQIFSHTDITFLKRFLLAIFNILFSLQSLGQTDKPSPL